MDPEYARENFFRYNTGYDYSDPRLDFGRPRTDEDVDRFRKSIRVKDAKDRTLRVQRHRGPFTITIFREEA